MKALFLDSVISYEEAPQITYIIELRKLVSLPNIISIEISNKQKRTSKR